MEPTSSEICATAALKVRNASNAINGLLLEALKPFEDRKREEDESQALEEKNAGGIQRFGKLLRQSYRLQLRQSCLNWISRLRIWLSVERLT